MLIIDTILGLFCAMGVLGAVMQMGLLANMLIINQNADGPTEMELLTPPDGVEEQVVSPDGTTLQVWHKGSGPAVLLIHEVGLSSVSMNQLWRRFASYGYQVITFDLRGHGDSDLGADGFAAEAMASDIQSVISFFDLRSVLLVGQGGGAHLAYQYLLRNPSQQWRVRGAVSLAGFAGGVYNRFEAGSLRHFLLLHGVVQRLMNHRAFAWGYVSQVFGSRVSRSHIGALLHLMRQRELAHFLPLYAAFSQENLTSSLGRVSVPSLIVASQHDRRIGATHSHDLAQHLPEAKLMWAEKEAGSMLCWEAPHWVVEEVRVFEKENPLFAAV